MFLCASVHNSRATQFSLNYQAIMFLSLSCVSITFANLFIFFTLFSLAALGPGKLQGVGTKPFQLFATAITLNSTPSGKMLVLSSLRSLRDTDQWFHHHFGFSFCFTLVFMLQGYTALHIAALHGHRHILDLLVGSYGKSCFL